MTVGYVEFKFLAMNLHHFSYRLVIFQFPPGIESSERDRAPKTEITTQVQTTQIVSRSGTR